MSGAEIDGQQAWQEEFFNTQDRKTPAHDEQPGWQLTAIGVTIGLMALLILSV